MNILKDRVRAYDELLLAARGETQVDTLITGGKILNVMTGEILPGDIAIHQGFIVSLFTQGVQAKQRIDASGKIALPAFIDPHIHIESSMVLPPQYAQIVSANGTGTVLADPHEIVNVMGVDGFSLMTENASNLPVRFFFDIPTCVPSKRSAESSGADIQAPEIEQMAQLGGRKLGELMSYEEIVAGDAILTGIIKTGWELGLPRDAHFPMIDILGGMFNELSVGQKLGVFAGMIGAQLLKLRALNALPYRILINQLRKRHFRDLNAYLVALGLTADHETYGPELQIKLDHGMRLMISSHIFSLPQTMPLLLQAVKELRYKDAIGLCTDDIWPDELIEKGGMVGVLRDLIHNGIHPIDAIRFATINNAQRLAQAGIPEAALIGALSPGMVADIVLVSEPLRKLKVDLVLHEGEIVAENGKTVSAVPAPHIPESALHTVRVSPITPDTFRIPAPPAAQNGFARVRVLSMPKPPAMPFPSLEEATLPIQDGYLDTSGYLQIAVFNRYGKGGSEPVLGLIKGYSLKDGAAASTLSHDSHNLIVLGTNPTDMALAVNQVIETGGGLAAYRNTEKLANIAFPVGGLMSPAPVEEIAAAAGAFRQAIARLGLDPRSPIFPFALFSLPVAPGAKVTDKGIWNPAKKELLPLLIEG